MLDIKWEDFETVLKKNEEKVLFPYFQVTQKHTTRHQVVKNKIISSSCEDVLDSRS